MQTAILSIASCNPHPALQSYLIVGDHLRGGTLLASKERERRGRKGSEGKAGAVNLRRITPTFGPDSQVQRQT